MRHLPRRGEPLRAANALSVQLGGIKLAQTGTRAAPSLTYAAATPFFSEHFYESDDDGNEALDQGPTGGPYMGWARESRPRSGQNPATVAR